MTPDDLFAALEGKKIILHRGQVFFNERDFEEVSRWTELGARSAPWFDEEQVASRKAKPWRPPLPQGWEVHVLPMLEEYWVTDESEEGEYDAFPEELRELCRQSI